MMIINDDSRVVNKLETSLTDDARVIIYDRHGFIEQRPGGMQWKSRFLHSHLIKRAQLKRLLEKDRHHS